MLPIAWETNGKTEGTPGCLKSSYALFCVTICFFPVDICGAHISAVSDVQ